MGYSLLHGARLARSAELQHARALADHDRRQYREVEAERRYRRPWSRTSARMQGRQGLTGI